MVLVLILNFFVGVGSSLLINFLLGSLGVILGLSIFLSGIDLSISKIGTMMGDFLARFNKIFKVVLFGIFIGFVISMAEPDLLILASQVTYTVGLSPWIIVAIISLGVGIMISIGLYRIFKEIKISKIMWILYITIFALMFIASETGHAIAFDASGATTGAMTIPFIIALGIGVANLKGDYSEDNSFGLVGIASTGPIIAGLLMSLSVGDDLLEMEATAHTSAIATCFKNSTFAIVPIALVFFIINAKYFKTAKDEFTEILLGLFYNYIGLIIFLSSVEGGLMELARILGEELIDSKFLPLVAFIMGLVVVLAEPVEDVTGGSIARKSILKALSIGVAPAVMLAIIRIKSENFALWMVIVPGFLISLLISLKIPQTFAGIAFDSGGVASGPMTATFILSFCQELQEM